MNLFQGKYRAAYRQTDRQHDQRTTPLLDLTMVAETPLSSPPPFRKKKEGKEHGPAADVKARQG